MQMKEQYKQCFNGIKKFGCGILISSIVLTQPMSVWATSSSKAAQEKKQAEKDLQSANEKAQQAAEKKNSAQAEVNKLNSKLAQLLADIEILEMDMRNKEEEIQQATQDYEEAKQREEEQYSAMKKRIRYMYEKGDTEYLDIFLKVKSMSDLLNKTEYVEGIYTYDRNMLVAYQETKQQVEDFREQLEDDKSEMEVMEQEYASQKSNLESTITEQKKKVSNFDSQLAQAKKDAAIYAKSVEEKTIQLRQAKEAEAKKKAEAEAKKKAAAAAAASASKSTTAKKTPASSNNTYTGPAAVKSTGGTATGRAIADYGLKFVGNPYVFGGTSLTNGADCSGFTQGVYRNFGISLPRTSTDQRSVGVGVSYADAQPGDLICYSGHVAIYIGNGQIVHASSPKTGIKVGSATYRTILAVRRVVQ